MRYGRNTEIKLNRKGSHDFLTFCNRFLKFLSLLTRGNLNMEYEETSLNCPLTIGSFGM
jgi:hypothetical protein